MGNLLFSPNGRIGPNEFWRGAIILIVLGALIQLAPLVSLTLGMVLGLLGLVLIWCWVVLWIKRFHDGGKSGWMSLIPIAVFILLSWIVSMVVASMFMGDMAQDMAVMTENMENMAEDDPSAALGGMMDMVSSMGKKTALPSAISGAIVSALIAYVGNMLIKQDPEENQWGSVNSASTFD